MSHVYGRSSKDKSSRVFYRKLKPASKNVLPTGSMCADCKCGKCSKSDDIQPRRKRLRSRKERNQIRDAGKEPRRANSCHHYYNHPTSKDVSCVHQYCPNASEAPSVTHEPCVITDGRLIGHHGLFNHEVKSIDIERLLSEQRKLDRGEKLQENKKSVFSTSSKEIGNLLESPEEEAVISKRKDSPTFNYSKCPEKKTIESNSNGSHLTPGQRLRKTLISSTEINHIDNSPEVIITEMKEVQPAVNENKSDLRHTQDMKSVLPASVPFVLESTPINPVNTRQASHSHPPPLLSSSSSQARASSHLNTPQEIPDAVSVAMSLKAISASLCNSISFPLLRKRNLVADTRQTIGKALRQRHGAQLKSSILKIQQRLCYSDVGQEEVSEPVYTDRKEMPFLSGEFHAPFKATGFATSSSEKTEGLHFDWSSTGWSNPLDLTAEWFGTSTENPVVPDGTFSRRGSPKFRMDFQFRNSASRERERLLSPSFAPSCANGPRLSAYADNIFIKTQGKECAIPETTSAYMTFSDIIEERHRGSPLACVVNNYSVNTVQSMPFPQTYSPFETYKCSHVKSFSDEIPNFHEEHCLEPSSHISFPIASPALRPVDLALYPPSHMLDKSLILSTSSSFPSPEHWSFPPMRLY